MAEIKSYRDLDVWKLSMDLAQKVYEITERFPKRDLYGIVSQMTRSASSVPANIAEGYGRMSRAEYLRFLYIARGSLTEFETHLILAVRIGRVSREEIKELWDISQSISKMLRRLILALKKKQTA
jgi:four helix bundle protein